ncbi:MAG: hypothetical protein HY704_15470 [Gemmatimonadetes bacterium]|nr:hypothetical protein [Gemmatimonadota bacterium]
MTAWLVPLCLFATLGALYLGGAPIRIEGGGGPRELVGLVLSLALYLALWAVLRAMLRGPAGVAAALVAASVLSVIALPAVYRIGFRIVRVRIRRVPRHDGGEEHAHA